MANGRGSQFPSVISISIIDQELEAKRKEAPSINKSFLIISKSLLDQNLTVKSSNHHIDLYQELSLTDHTFLLP